MKFVADEKGLYILEYKKMENYNQIEGFLHQEVEKAKRTRRLYHQLAAPSVVAFKSLLRQNLIKNCDVTEKDITLTENIFGTDVPTLKGKSTRPKPRTVVDEEIEIPKEFISKNKNLELVMDIVFINSETLLTTVDRSILFKACIPLPSREDEEIYKGLDIVLRHYDKGGYVITKIHADGEFESLLLRIKDNMNIDVNIENPDEHVGDIERLNHTLQ